VTFFEELKRRKVYRVAVAYVIAAGGIIQLASAVFPAWEFPDWILRVLVVLLLAGFPIGLVLAWAFDITPQGIQTTLPLAPSISGSAHRRRNIFLLAGLGLAISIATGFFLLPRAVANRTEKSIAVLPFENLSADQKNAFFADGVQDDILTNLSKIGDLKVISRTSVMGYRGESKSAREIGKELGVSALLEGSVRREGNRVRVNVQLINATNDEHVWAEDYDRDLTDVFAIQTDLAQKIAHELQAHLSPREQEAITRKPTENNEAFLVFGEARELQGALEDIDKQKKAARLYERAIELDPKFALAVAHLSIVHSWLYHEFEPTPAQRDLAKEYADRALQLAPQSPEAHLARGYYLYYGERDYGAALKEFAVAQGGLPNNSDIYLVIGAIQRRQGLWKESTANLKKAVNLNPIDSWPLQNLFFNYWVQRDFDAANRVIDQALAIDPKSFTLLSLKAKLVIFAWGDFKAAESAIEKFRQEMNQSPTEQPDPITAIEMPLVQADLSILQRKYPDALKALDHLPPETPEATVPRIEVCISAGIAHEKMGEAAEARRAFLKAKDLAEAEVRNAPNGASRRALLARALAYLGEKDAAIAESKRAMELQPESVDAFEGPDVTAVLAEVYALTGENTKSIALLDGLLSRPGYLTVTLLKLDPAWDGLRDEPAFRGLLKKYESKT
jgi:TolB-like protein